MAFYTQTRVSDGITEWELLTSGAKLLQGHDGQSIFGAPCFNGRFVVDYEEQKILKGESTWLEELHPGLMHSI